MKLFAFLERQKTTWILLIVSFSFTLLRLPSLFEPYWYGDEGIYEVIGAALRQGRLLYSGIWDNKPPLLYYLYALVNGDQFGARLLSLLAGIGILITFYFVAKKITENVQASTLATIAFVLLFGTPLIEGNIANAENFMLFPTLLAVLSLLFFITKHLPDRKSTQQYKKLILPGLLLGLSFMIKAVGVFDFAACFVFLFIATWEDFQIKHLLQQARLLFLFSISFFTPLIWFIVLFLIRGNLKAFLQSAFASNVGYVSYGNSFIIPQGFLILKLLLLGGFLFFLFRKRVKLSSTRLFVFIWLGFSLFSALFSGRPYTHYLLVLLPSFCLLIGSIFSDKQYRKIDVVILFILVIFVSKSFILYHKPFSYYTNFLSFITQKESVTQYQSFFDPAVSRDMDIVQIILLHKTQTQTLFVWGNDGQIYKLTNTLPQSRYIVAYHGASTPLTLKEVKQVLSKNPPKIVVLLPDQPPIPMSLIGYQQIIALNGAFIYERSF